VRRFQLKRCAIAAAAGYAIFALCPSAAAAEGPSIFPTPREITPDSDFVLDEQAVVAVPAYPSEQDLFLARSLADDLGDRFAVHLKTERLARLDPARRMIVIGSIDNPLVRTYCGSHSLSVSLRDPGPEGYILQTSGDIVLVAGSDDPGAFLRLTVAAATRIPRAGSAPLQRSACAGLAGQTVSRHQTLYSRAQQHPVL